MKQILGVKRPLKKGVKRQVSYYAALVMII